MGIGIRIVKEKELENNILKTRNNSENGILVNYMAALWLNVNFLVIGGNGGMTNGKDMEHTRMVVLYTTDNGCRIRKTGMQYKIGMTILFIKENLKTMSDMVMDIWEAMAQNIMDSGSTVIKRESTLKSRKATYTQRYIRETGWSPLLNWIDSFDYFWSFLF
jgi:hypothetical protein